MDVVILKVVLVLANVVLMAFVKVVSGNGSFKFSYVPACSSDGCVK